MYFYTPVLKCFKLIKKINNKKSKKTLKKQNKKQKHTENHFHERQQTNAYE